MATYGYCRVSTARQANEGESLDVQRRQIEGYAHMHGLALSGVVVEEGVSGSTPVHERPEGSILFGTLKTGDTVIASKLDRMFRSTLDALNVVEDFRKRGVRLVLLDLPGGDIVGGGMGKFFFTIIATFAEAERDRIRERTKQAKADQKNRGRFLGGRVPFGYKVSKAGDLVEVPEHLNAIADMRSMLDGGESLRAISTAMAARGIRISHMGVSNLLRQQA